MSTLGGSIDTSDCERGHPHNNDERGRDVSTAEIIGHEGRDELVYVRIAVALWPAAHADEILEPLPHAAALRPVIERRAVVRVELVDILRQAPDAARAVMHGITRRLERGRKVGRKVREADRQNWERQLIRGWDGVELGEGRVRAVAEERRQLRQRVRPRQSARVAVLVLPSSGSIWWYRVVDGDIEDGVPIARRVVHLKRVHMRLAFILET